MRVLSFEGDDVSLDLRRNAESVLEDRVRAVLEPRFAEVLIST